MAPEIYSTKVGCSDIVSRSSTQVLQMDDGNVVAINNHIDDCA